MRTTERMEKALQTWLYLFISYLHVASQTPVPHLCFSRDFLCANPHGLLSTGAVGWAGWVGTRGVRYPRGAQHRSPAKAAVGAWVRSGACLGKDWMDTLQLSHHVTSVTRALGRAQETRLCVTDQPDWWRGCRCLQASSGAALGFALVLGSCRRPQGTLFIPVAPSMAPFLQPPTALRQQPVPNTSLCTPFHPPAPSAASPKPRFPHCHSSPYATAVPFSPYFHPSLPTAGIFC